MDPFLPWVSCVAKPLLLSSGKRELEVDPPVMNAAGTLGWHNEAGGWLELRHLGAFITNPLSHHRRSPAANAGVAETAGGFVLHSGLPNPGLTAGLRKPPPANPPLPRIVHLIGDPAELETMILETEAHEHVAAIEIGLERPGPALLQVVGRLSQSAELPVVVRLGLDEPDDLFLEAAEAGCRALSFGPAHGRVARPEGPFGGRLYGPAMLPLMLAKLARLRAYVSLPLIAAGGIGDRQSAHAMLDAGADGIQLDFILWLDPSAVLPL
jgi:dihydroorotate dehydrogenase